jgi:hypothetical protein
MTKKKRAVKKKAAKKTARKSGRKKKAAKRDLRRPPGYKRRPGSGLLVPTDSSLGSDEIVPPSLMMKGMAEAKKQMKELIYEVSDNVGDIGQVSQMEFEASFNADGKFLGFGVGGAATIKISVDLTDQS